MSCWRQAPLQPLHPNAGAAAHFAHPGAVAPPPAAAAHAGGGARGLREQDVPPKVVFSIVKASDLKSLLERHGLPADGNREVRDVLAQVLRPLGGQEGRWSNGTG